MGTRWMHAVVIGICLSMTTALNAASTPSGRSYNIGINTGGPSDYSPDKPFADAMRQSRIWSGALDASGWPTADASIIVWTLATRNNTGTYKLHFTGSANVAAGSGQATISNNVYNSSTNTTTADVVITTDYSAGSYSMLSLFFTNTKRTSSSSTNTGVTNVKLMRPVSPGSTASYPTTTIYMDDYLNKLAPFTTIRYMGWSNTNEYNLEKEWATHTNWNYATLNRSGTYPNGSSGNYSTAWESIILLSNAANKDAWICIPHMTSDDYITKVAQMFRYGSDGVNPYTSVQSNPVVPPLNSNLKLYIEYSNEIWHWGFPQTAYCRDQGVAYGAPLNFDGETNDVTLLYRFKGMRSVQISTIFRSVFGDAAMMTRVRPVLCWQQSYLDLCNRTLSFIDRYYNKRDSRSTAATAHPINYYFYGGSGSGYWYTDGTTTMTSDNIWTNGSWDPTYWINNNVGYNTTWTTAYGLANLAYEGDAHPAGSGYGGSNNDDAIMRATHWDPRMNAETQEHLQAWASIDGGMFCFLVLNNWSPCVWGVYNNYDGLASSPQYQAIQSLNTQTPPDVSRGKVVPFTSNGAACDFNGGSTGSYNLIANSSGYLGYTIAWTFRTTSNGTCIVQVGYSTIQAATMVLEYDGNVIGTYSLANTSGVAATTANVNIDCPTNKLHAIKITCTSGAVTIRNLSVGSGAISALITTSNSAKASNLSIYPNPVKSGNLLTIAGVSRSETINIQIFDLSGKVLGSEKVARNKGLYQLNASGLSEGVYLLQIRNNGYIVNKKLIIR